MKTYLYLPRYRVQSVILNGLFAGFRTVVQRSNYVAFRDRSIHVERARLQLENTQYKTKVFNLSRDFYHAFSMCKLQYLWDLLPNPKGGIQES